MINIFHDIDLPYMPKWLYRIFKYILENKNLFQILG